MLEHEHRFPAGVYRRAPLVLGLAATFVVFTQAWVSDDAFITFRAVDNFVNGYGPVFNPGERVQVFTHPLWFFLLSIGGLFRIDLYYWSILLSLIATFAAFNLLGRILPPVLASLATAVLLTSPSFLEFQTSGLENSLTHLLLIAFIYVLVTDLRPLDTRRALRLGLLAGLLMLNRLDLVVLLWPVVLLLALRAPVSLAGLAPLALWCLFSLVYYGTVLPNTVHAKYGAYGFADGIRHGLTYVADFARFEPLHFGIGALGLGLGLGEVSRSEHRYNFVSWALLALLSGAVLYVLFVVYGGGDFMRGRMLMTPLVVGVICGAVILDRSGVYLPMPAAAAGVAVLAASFLFAMPTLTDTAVTDSGIVRERSYYQFLWLSNRRAESNVNQFGAQQGAALRRYAEVNGPITIRAVAVGLLGYYAGPGVTILDEVGLTDPFVARHDAIPGSRPGHVLRFVPRDYYRIRGDISQLQDWEARLAALDPTLRDDALAMAAETAWPDRVAAEHYADVRRVVSGALFGGDRLRLLRHFTFPGGLLPAGDDIPRAERGAVRVYANYVPAFGNFVHILGLTEAGQVDGANWDDGTRNVSLNSTSSWVMIDLGQAETLRAVSLQADNNDDYVVEFSDDGSDFGFAWHTGAATEPGMQTRTTEEGFERTARYIRIHVEKNDGFYSLGRLSFTTDRGTFSTPPSPPLIGAENAAVGGDGEASVAWQPPTDDGGAPILQYVVVASPGGIRAETEDAQARSLTVTGLENGTEYTFTVIAVNEVGESGPIRP